MPPWLSVVSRELLVLPVTPHLSQPAALAKSGLKRIVCFSRPSLETSLNLGVAWLAMEKGRDGAPQYVAPRTCGLIGLGGLRKRDVVGVMRWGTDSSLIFPLSRPTDQALPRLACELSPAQPSAGVVEPQEHRRQKSWVASTPPPLLSSARPAPRPADPVPAAAPQRWRTWPVWRMEMGGNRPCYRMYLMYIFDLLSTIPLVTEPLCLCAYTLCDLGTEEEACICSVS